MPRCISSTSPEAEIGQHIFGAAAEAGHGLAVEPRQKILLQRKPQILAPRLRLTIFAPSITGCRPRRTVSTSGSSGMSMS